MNEETRRPIIVKYESGGIEAGHLNEGCKLTTNEAGDEVYEFTVDIDPVASRAYRAQLAEGGGV